jgi:hypothetical protein
MILIVQYINLQNYIFLFTTAIDFFFEKIHANFLFEMRVARNTGFVTSQKKTRDVATTPLVLAFGC